MDAIGVDTALVFPEAPADEHPLWSPDGRDVALNIHGKWITTDLTGLTLSEATWHGDTIGVNYGLNDVTFRMLETIEVNKWRAATQYGGRKVTAPNGLIMEMRSSGLGVVFVTTTPNKVEEKLWKTVIQCRFHQTLVSFCSSAN